MNTRSSSTNFIANADAHFKSTPIQHGENGHAEYGWSKDIDEKTLQLYFQIVRSNDHTMIKENLTDLLTDISKLTRTHKNTEKLAILYKLIAQTRDIISGKGEYMATYVQILTWYDFFPELAMFALERLVHSCGKDENNHPYGSWKDIKFFAKYVYETTKNKNHPLIEHCVSIMNHAVNADLVSMNLKTPVSLASKWCPREKSSMKWFYKKLVYNNARFSGFFAQAVNDESKRAAYKKACMIFRKNLSTLNKHIDTTEIKMCGHEWSDIDFNKVPSCALGKNQKAFLNKNKESNKLDEDRVRCATNLTTHLYKIIANKENSEQATEKVKVNGKRVGIYDFVSRALGVLKHSTECDLINLQWDENSKLNAPLPNIIPMADVSPSMECDYNTPMYNSIGLSIRVSEKTTPAFKNRILTFSSNPKWVNLDGCDDFVSKVKTVSEAEWGNSTNFVGAMNEILDIIVKHNMEPESVKDMVLMVFSDMQFDNSVTNGQYFTSINEVIKKNYYDAGMKTKYNRPYSPPHIVFWNLRQTTGFPALSTDKNVTMISGFSSVLLNEFCEKGISVLENYTPYNSMINVLSNKRYKIMEDKVKNMFI